MKVVLIFSLSVCLYCQFVTIHPDHEKKLFITFLISLGGVLVSGGYLIFRLIRKPRP